MFVKDPFLEVSDIYITYQKWKTLGFGLIKKANVFPSRKPNLCHHLRNSVAELL